MTRLVLRVRCTCGWEQNVQTIKSFRCYKCGKSNKVFPKKGFSRIVKIINGAQKDLDVLFYRTYKRSIG